MSTHFNMNLVQDSIDKIWGGLQLAQVETPFFDFELKGLGLSYHDDINGINPP